MDRVSELAVEHLVADSQVVDPFSDLHIEIDQNSLTGTTEGRPGAVECDEEPVPARLEVQHEARLSYVKEVLERDVDLDGFAVGHHGARDPLQPAIWSGEEAPGAFTVRRHGLALFPGLLSTQRPRAHHESREPQAGDDSKSLTLRHLHVSPS